MISADTFSYTGSRAGSRTFVTAVGGLLALSVHWTFAQVAIPDSWAAELHVLSPAAYSIAFIGGLFAGFFVSLAPIRTADIGWKYTHNVEAVLEPILAPLLTRMTTAQVERVRKSPDRFVHEVFLPLIGADVSTEHLRERFYTFLALQRSARVTRLILSVGVITAVVIGSVSSLPNRGLWFWLGSALVMFVLAEIALRRTNTWMARVSVEEVRWIHANRQQQLIAKLTTFCGPLAFTAPGISAVAPHGSYADSVANLMTAGEVEYRVAEAVLSAKMQIVFRFPTTALPEKWEYHLVPAILYARHRGVSVHFAIRKDVASPERGAYRLMRGLGCTVSYHPMRDDLTNELSCVLVDPGLRTAAVVFMTADGSPIRGIAAHGPHVRNLAAALAEHTIPEKGSDAALLPRLVSVPMTVIRSRLRRVPEYRNGDCDITLSDVELQNTRPMSPTVRLTGKLQVPYFATMFADAKLDLFAPACIALGDDLHSLILPPVLESDPKGYLRVHEGHSRMYEYWQRASNGGAQTIKAIVVHGCEPPPRMRMPLTWDDVVESTDLVKDTSYDHSHGIESWTRAKVDGRGRKLPELDFLTTAELNA